MINVAQNKLSNILKTSSSHIIIVLILLICFLSSSSIFADTKRTREAYSLYNEAVSAYRTRHFTLAKEIFYKLLKEHPDEEITSIARINLANLLKDLKEYDKAIEVNREIIEKSKSLSDKTNAKIELVDILYSIHRYREGIELLEDWVKNNDDTTKSDELACKLAMFYLQSGNKDEAWLLLEKHLERGSKKAFNTLLDLAIKSGEVDKLLSSLESHRTRLRGSVYTTYVADCYLALGRKDKAIDAIKDNKYYTSDTILLKKLADIQISANKIDDAIESLDRLMKMLPSDKQTNRKLGHCYFLKGDKPKAVDIWKLPLNRPYNRNLEEYTDYTSILIEHQLLEKALEAFDEARGAIGPDTLFAEEKAAVLEALGREKEAMEENLKALAHGIYKSEIFDKLYKAKIDGFSLENRLISLNSYDNQSIKQALIEFYFRKARIADIEKLVKLIDEESAIFFDELFYDRLRQEALLVPEDFHFSLIKRIMDSRKDSALELKLASLILKMPEYNEKWQKDAYKYAKKAAESEYVADSTLKYQLYLKLAEFAFDYMKSPKEAEKYLALLLKRNLPSPSKSEIIEAKLMRAKINTYMSEFAKSEEILNDAKMSIESSNVYGGLTRLEQEDYLMQQKIETARLKTHMGQYQEALNSLKDIVENHKEGEWVNDGLELALDITRFSVGDFSAIEHRYKAKRLAASGQNSEAIEEIDAAIKSLSASSTFLIADLEAEKLLLTDETTDLDDYSIKSQSFMAQYPDNLKNPDIIEHKILLMQRLNKSQDVIDEEMRSFIHNFPSDLRSEKYKQSLENGGKK